MAKLIAFFIAVLAFQAVLAAPKKKHDQQGGTQEVSDVVQQVKVVVDDVTDSLKKVLPDQKQVSEDLAKKSQDFVRDVENIIKKLQTEIDENKGSADNLIKEVTAKLTENINALKKAVGPDATTKINEIRTEIENHFKNSAAEVEKLANIVGPKLEKAGESVNNFAKGILDDFLAAAKNLQTQVDSTIQGNPSSRKIQRQ